MKRRSSLTAVTLAVGVVAGGIVGFAPAASADSALIDVYKDANEGGPEVTFTTASFRFGVPDIVEAHYGDLRWSDGTSMGDSVSSIVNNSSSSIVFYKDGNFGGANFTLAPHSAFNTLPSGFNDTISSSQNHG